MRNMGSYKAQGRTLTSQQQSCHQKGQEEGRLPEPEGQKVMHIWLPSFEGHKEPEVTPHRGRVQGEKCPNHALRSPTGPSPFGNQRAQHCECNTGTSSEAGRKVEKGGERTWRSK